MNTLKMNTLELSSAGYAASKREGPWGLVADRPAQHSFAPMVIARDAGKQDARSIKTFPGLQTPENISRSPSRTIAIKNNGWIHFFDATDIATIEAQGNYVSLQCRSGSILLRESISFVADVLLPYGFVRIHRSVIVNMSCVEQIAARVTGEYDLRLKNGKQYPISKFYKRNLSLLADLWLGRSCFLPSM